MLLNLGRTYAMMKNPQTALEFYTQALAIFTRETV